VVILKIRDKMEGLGFLSRNSMEEKKEKITRPSQPPKKFKFSIQNLVFLNAQP